MDESSRKSASVPLIPPTHPSNPSVQHLIRTAAISSTFLSPTHPPTSPTHRLKGGIEEETEVIRQIAEEINEGFGQRIFPMVASSQHCKWVGGWVDGWVIGR